MKTNPNNQWHLKVEAFLYSRGTVVHLPVFTLMCIGACMFVRLPMYIKLHRANQIQHTPSAQYAERR